MSTFLFLNVCKYQSFNCCNTQLLLALWILQQHLAHSAYVIVYLNEILYSLVKFLEIIISLNGIL
uniref:Uncharacterized protein n=1 Tax=uncultured marine virus TaxID=186617 RepID=A0A0F7L8H1_9VIRU|nr:hypothetical protein [uncultured marine virus]